MTHPSTQRVATLFITAFVVIAAIASSGIGTVQPAAAAGNTSPTGMFAMTNEYDDHLTPAAADIEDLIGYTIPADAKTYGAAGDPGFIVYYETDRYTALEAWINDSSTRELISHTPSANRALVAAPPAEVLGGWTLGLPPARHRGLADRSYIELIDLNRQMSYTEPVDQLARTTDADPPLPASNFLIRGGEFTADGVAYKEDANRSTLGDARAAIDADQTSATGSAITVAVVDTGANVGDGEIYGDGTKGSNIRITAAKNFITDESVNVSAPNPDWSIVEDANGHGSWVASAVAANVSNDSYDGVAPDASLVIAKALDDDGQGSTEDIAQAIEYSERQGADVISLSLGSPLYSESIASAIRTALNGNTTLVVVAAGNSRQNPATRYISSPADVPEDGVIGVAASNTTSPENASVAYFSEVGDDNGADGSNGQTLGEGPDIAAPGMRVVAPVLSTTGARQNSSLSGTSMATPIVAGAAAQMLDANPGLVNDTAGAREQLLESASPMPQAGVTEAGNGMVNASNAVTDTRPEESQQAARNDAAERRDAANEQLGQSRALRFIAGAGDTVEGLVG